MLHSTSRPLSKPASAAAPRSAIARERPLAAAARQLRPAAAALLALAGSAQAALVTVSVQDGAGKPLAGAVVTLESTGARLPVKPAANVDIAQSKRQFRPQVTVVTVGTAVLFPNFDTVRHHVYSFSAIRPFELKLYAGVPTAPVVFDKPGIAVLGCNIHDEMAAWVVVVDTPFYGRSGADGKVRIEAVPAGAYRLRAWHPGLGVDAPAPTVPLAVAAADIEHSARLAVAVNPLSEP